MACCCQYSDLKPGGGFLAFHGVLVFIRAASGIAAVSYTEVWVVASDQQVMYWAPKRKRPLHSSAYRLILQWGRALPFDTARAVAVHRLSGHAISQLLSRNKSVVSANAKVA